MFVLILQGYSKMVPFDLNAHIRYCLNILLEDITITAVMHSTWIPFSSFFFDENAGCFKFSLIWCVKIKICYMQKKKIIIPRTAFNKCWKLWLV